MDIYFKKDQFCFLEDLEEVHQAGRKMFADGNSSELVVKTYL